MSRNIVIKEDGVAKQLTVDKLKTNLVNSGTCLWTPETEMNVAKLKVWKNGTYAAESMNVAGFDIVEVGISSAGGAGAELVGDAHISQNTKHDTTIQEGTIARLMGGVKRIKVDLQNGGTLVLAADDDVELGIKSITENGTYKAKDDGYGGYSSVTVNVSGGGGGGGGDVPTRIAVTVQPNKINYSDGDTIDYTGITVVAYKADDSVYGTIPFDSLIFPTTEAEYDNGNVYSDLDTEPLIQPINVSSLPITWYNSEQLVTREIISNAKCCIVIRDTRYDGFYGKKYYFIIASDNETTYVQNMYEYDAEGHVTRTITTNGDVNNRYTHNGKDVYYYYNTTSGTIESISPTTGSIDTDMRHIFEIAWTMLYGSSPQTVPVQWRRPNDGEILETSIVITVSGLR